MKAPDFDPYELLGIDGDADAETIDRAYKARIRLVHPDIAGSAGLVETKRLNLAREWLLDPELRRRLPRPSRRWRATAEEVTQRHDPHPSWDWDVSSAPNPAPAWDYDPFRDDPLTFDYGAATDRLRALFRALRSLTDDERARLTYGMGDEPPGSFEAYRDVLSEQAHGRSRALHDAVSQLWQEREDEIAPLDFPKGHFHGGGPAVVNAYGHWLLLGDELRRRVPDGGGLDRLAYTCTWPWEASVGQPRYGARHDGVSAFLRDAAALSPIAAERLARTWQRDMGTFLYGRPGEDWFPGGNSHPKPDLVSARLAAVDASRVQPPADLAASHRVAFHNGLRLAAYVLALGGVAEQGRDYLRPWKEAMDDTPTFYRRARYGLPRG
jgi:curved DNA-binding protein CbpA